MTNSDAGILHTSLPRGELRELSRPASSAFVGCISRLARDRGATRTSVRPRMLSPLHRGMARSGAGCMRWLGRASAKQHERLALVENLPLVPESRLQHHPLGGTMGWEGHRDEGGQAELGSRPIRARWSRSRSIQIPKPCVSQ